MTHCAVKQRFGPALAMLLAAFWGTSAYSSGAAQSPPPKVCSDLDVPAWEAEHKCTSPRRAAIRNIPPSANQLDWDAVYYRLDLSPNHAVRQLTATVLTRGLVLAQEINQVDLDLASNMTVNAVRSGGTTVSFTHVDDLLTISLDRGYTQGEVFCVEVDYHGDPSGWHFSWDMWNGRRLTWTSSEPYGAREWWPCKDQVSDKADSVDIYVTADGGFEVASNGTLMSVTPAGTQYIHHWHEGYPISTYLVAIAIYPYVQFSDWYVYAPADSMEVKFFVAPENYNAVQELYGKTVGMIETFADMFGEYPFTAEKYGHAQVSGGAMENQTCSFIRGGATESTIVHELAHQWWGDFVTCESFHHIWLNEGFATYCEALYREETEGEQALHEGMSLNAFFGPGTIYVEDPSDVNSIFDPDLSYRKASWVLHMLRHVLGDVSFFRVLQTYYTAFGGGTATTEDFRGVAESVSGQSLGSFFQQWIYGEGFPIYEYAWDAQDVGGNWEVELRVNQVQTNQIFTMPIDVEIVFAEGGNEVHVLQNGQATQDYLLTVAREPVHVRLDPEEWILCERRVGIMNPTFDQGILLVNGLDWGALGSEVLDAYEQRAFWGNHDIAFWDLFSAPPGGYPGTLPAPLGHGAVPAPIMGRYSSVVWIGNAWNGDLELWFESPNLSYLQAGGNMLLMTKRGSDFFTEGLRNYLEIDWWGGGVLNGANATYPGLRDMTAIGDQSNCSYFYPESLGTETTLLFIDASNNLGIGAWRAAVEGGDFVFVSGRPQRWDRGALRDNADFILRSVFGEGGSVAVVDSIPGSGGHLRLGTCAPNPVRESTRIGFELPGTGLARVRIYDVAGRLVQELFESSMESGPQVVTWDTLNGQGQPVGAGVYYIRLEAVGGHDQRSVVVLR